MNPLQLLLIAACAAIPVLIVIGAQMIRAESRRRHEMATRSQKFTTQTLEHGRAMARASDGASTPPKVGRYIAGGEVLAAFDEAPDRPGGPRRAEHVAMHLAPGQTIEAALRAELARLEDERDRLRLENARLRSEMSLCPAPSEVARLIRDEGPIGTEDIARRLQAPPEAVHAEALQLTITRNGIRPPVSTFWPELIGGVSPEDLRLGIETAAPLWVWTDRLDDMDLTQTDVGQTDWEYLAAMIGPGSE